MAPLGDARRAARDISFCLRPLCRRHGQCSSWQFADHGNHRSHFYGNRRGGGGRVIAVDGPGRPPLGSRTSPGYRARPLRHRPPRPLSDHRPGDHHLVGRLHPQGFHALRPRSGRDQQAPAGGNVDRCIVAQPRQGPDLRLHHLAVDQTRCAGGFYPRGHRPASTSHFPSGCRRPSPGSAAIS